MTASQLALPLEAKLPLDPHALLDLPPIARGELFNDLDLDSWQRACIEEAIRMLRAGEYPEGR